MISEEIKKIQNEEELMRKVSEEICGYFGFYDMSIGNTFYHDIKKGGFEFIHLRCEKAGVSDED